MTVRLIPFACAVLLFMPVQAGAHPSAPLGYDPAEIGRIGVQIAMEGDAERACQAASQPDPGLAADVERRSEARLAQYFERIGGDDHGSVTHLFIDSGSKARWAGPEGSQPVTAIADPIGAQRGKGTLTRKSFVVGNDAQTSRGIWVLTIPDAADPSKTDTFEYAVDFKLGMFGGMWIWHMRRYGPPDVAPPPPAHYCHIDPALYY
ncbi:MAG TPA: hypothetical protein VMF58_07615 [Rhizomicrobium sp.]|nr:hypothetical protein [Rhizomicrobium sp.]